ncbi:hypothetical protein HYV49_05255 [Candidatus Pacearchaeota archaeon]|nr:hypothetical protein [Candidatus Pacearchaeota archaeon]
MNNNPNIEHSEECYQKYWKPCKDNKAHSWSGWPGAFCMECGIEDYNEACLAGCECQCHEEFWKEYEEYCKKTEIKE